MRNCVELQNKRDIHRWLYLQMPYKRIMKNFQADISLIFADELKLIGSRILVQFEYWDDELEDSREEKLFLQADNGSYFTASELIYKIHNQSATS